MLKCFTLKSCSLANIITQEDTGLGRAGNMPDVTHLIRGDMVREVTLVEVKQSLV